jgi:NAD(P)-dependent dehydrogenase (short-subunit alcohol dehydrogenase family)
MLLSNKTVVITGSSRGIGLALAEACAQNGASVVISSRNASSVDKAVDYLKQKSYSVSGVRADVTNTLDLKILLGQAIRTYGRVDIWINNAGIAGGFRTLQSIPTGEIREIVEINLLGMLYSCNLVIPYFIEHGSGIIINVSGKGGKGDASPYLTTYAATKAAVTSLTRSLAKENKKQAISINCVFPGIVETDMWQNIKTCPEAVSQVEIIPRLIDAWANPVFRVSALVVKLCSQEPGKKSGKCYSCGSAVRYLRAPFVFFRHFAKKNNKRS